MNSAEISRDVSHPVRLASRSSQGIVLGLMPSQMFVLITAGVITLIAAMGYGIPGLVGSMIFAVPAFAFAVKRIHGIPAPRMAGLWMMKKMRQKVGATRSLYRPERQHLEGTLNLPGGRAGIQVWDVDGLASAYDPHARTVSITAEVEVPGFLMKDVHERAVLSEQWGQVLAQFTQRPGIARVSVQERTTPTTIRAARKSFEDAQDRGVQSPQSAQDNYEAVLETVAGFHVSHRTYLTLTFNLLSMSAQLKLLGGGKEAIQTLAAVEAGNVSEALQGAGVEVRRWLGPRHLAALARIAVDPASVAMIHDRDAENEGVDLRAVGAMYVEEPAQKHGIVYTDSAVHTTMWIHEWPRTAAPVGFVESVIFARNPVTLAAIPHIFTTVMKPTSTATALKQVQKQKKVWRANSRLRAKRGGEDTAGDEMDFAALLREEEELVNGHGQFTYGAYLTISAEDESTLENNVAGMRNALSRVGMEGQILYCQQAEALFVSALPIGRGMK